MSTFANKEEKRLLLFAEMKVPGEASIEFYIKDGEIHQEAAFRPLGFIRKVVLVFCFHHFTD